MAVNDAPIASNNTLAVTEDTPAASALAASDVESDPLTYSIVSQGNKDIATITNASTGAFSYAPNPNANGSDSFTFKANDGTVDSNVATISVTINPTNDAPTISAIADRTINEGSATGALDVGIADAETPAGSLTLAASSSNPTLVPDANIVLSGSGATRTVTVTPVPGQYSVAIITLTVTDANTASAQSSFTLTVNGTPRFSAPAEGAALNTTSVGVSGQASPGALVTLSEGTTALCSVTASGNGSWSCTPTLSQGQHTLSPVATLNGVTSPAATRSVTVDLTAPAAPVVGSADTTTDPTPAFQGTAEPGSTITLGIDLYLGTVIR